MPESNLSEQRISQILASIRAKDPRTLAMKELAFVHKYDVLTNDEKSQIARLRQHKEKQARARTVSVPKPAPENSVEAIENELADEYDDARYVRADENEGHVVARGSLRMSLSEDGDETLESEYDREREEEARYAEAGKVRRALHKMRKNPVLIFSVVLLFLIIFVFRSYVVPSESMYPTLKIGDRVVGTAIYFPNGDSVNVGDVVCFYPPGTTNEIYVKRVIAKGGDRVQISGDTIYVNGEVSPYGGSGGVLTSLDFTVSEGCYWMAGDNGAVSADSRVWGELPADRLICKLHAIYWPVDRAQLL